ncbi:MAG TPA: hypothetical protein PLX35_09540 [Cyclobacteriaceae bacterium]|nr:hypothetical protein [Cyclobacteriaceae bacterium]
MKFNLLSGILIVLLIISLVFAFFQKTEADAQRLMAQQNEAQALILRAEAEKKAAEVARMAEIATAEALHQAQLAREEVRKCMESKKR